MSAESQDFSKIIKNHLITNGAFYYCRNWQKFGFVNEPKWEDKFNAELEMAQKLRFHAKNFN